MATKKQKQELIDILKFTPVNVTLRIQGYGGESYAGKIDRATYDFFKKNKYDLEEYATDWDGEWNDKVPQELQPFSPGSPYDCDGLWHASGAELSNLNSLVIENNETGDTIWEIAPGLNELEDAGVNVEEFGGTDLDDLDEGTVVYWGGQGEKGCFFEGEFTLRAPFDPKLLKVGYENCDGWYIINFIEYDGEEIDGSGGYSTTGKWGENKWVIVGDEEVYESVPLEEREDEELPTIQELEEDSKEWDPATELDRIWDDAKTDWFDKDVNPAYSGTYEAVIDAEWPLSGIRMVEWTGRSWKEDGKKVAIKQWRGLSTNPAEFETWPFPMVKPNGGIDG